MLLSNVRKTQERATANKPVHPTFLAHIRRLGNQIQKKKKKKLQQILNIVNDFGLFDPFLISLIAQASPKRLSLHIKCHLLKSISLDYRRGLVRMTFK